MSEKIIVTVDADLEDLIPGFMDNRRKDVDKLREMIATSAFEELKLLGHSIKGVGGGYGFDAITDMGAAIEVAAESQDIEQLKQCAIEYEEYMQRVEVVFE